MEFEQLLKTVGNEPLFTTGFLLAGDIDPNNLRRQLVRWTQSGKVIQIRRSLYMLAPPYRKSEPHPFLIANQLLEPSYVSLQSALAFYGMIPEYVPVITSVTTKRTESIDNSTGRYRCHHIKTDFFHSYQSQAVSQNQQAYIAKPEKALMDLIYLYPGGDDLAYLQELRLTNLDMLDVEKLRSVAEQTTSPKLQRAAGNLEILIQEETEAGYETITDPSG